MSREDGIRNAIRIIKETGAGALKMEGGKEIADTVKGIVAAGIPVIGHLGLTPQSIHKFGGYGLRAKDDAEAEKANRKMHLPLTQQVLVLLLLRRCLQLWLLK